MEVSAKVKTAIYAGQRSFGEHDVKKKIENAYIVQLPYTNHHEHVHSK